MEFNLRADHGLHELVRDWLLDSKFYCSCFVNKCWLNRISTLMDFSQLLSYYYYYYSTMVLVYTILTKKGFHIFFNTNTQNARKTRRRCRNNQSTQREMETLSAVAVECPPYVCSEYIPHNEVLIRIWYDIRSSFLRVSSTRVSMPKAKVHYNASACNDLVIRMRVVPFKMHSSLDFLNFLFEFA